MAGDLIAFQTLAGELFLPKIANKTERKWLESNLRPSLFRIKIILRSQYLSISLTSTNRSNLLCLCYRSALLNKKLTSVLWCMPRTLREPTKNVQ